MFRRTFLATALAAGVVARVGHAAEQAPMGLSVLPRPRPLPDLDLRDDQGRPAGPAQWRGRPALVNLWASWCPPCVAELPSLDRLKPIIEPEGLKVVALNLDRSGVKAATATFARLNIHNLDIVVDAARQVSGSLGVDVLPTTLLVDSTGAEIARYVGGAAWDGPRALAMLRALIKGQPLDGAKQTPRGDDGRA